jgi:hypothetical protein
MESRSWYEQEKACEEIARREAQAAPHTVAAGNYAGNRAERRAQAAEDRKRLKRIKVLDAQL